MGTGPALWGRHCTRQGLWCDQDLRLLGHFWSMILVCWTIPVFAMMLCICLCVTFLTEVTSNTATTTLLMPILVIAALHADIDPLLLMLPAAISASCAFMLPVATAPNAIVYGTGAFPSLAWPKKVLF